MKIISDRNVAILEMLERGYTLQRVADEYGVSRQRIHQIRQRYGEKYVMVRIDGERPKKRGCR